MKYLLRKSLAAVVLLLLSVTAMAQDVTAMAQDEQPREYTSAQPLVYEESQDMWPYSFLDENGAPDGFNVELIRLIMERLDIPYVIKMKPGVEVFRDVKAGRADLMIGLATGYHQECVHYSENSVTLFTQSVLSPKDQPTTINNFYDLANQKVMVADSSFCHHMMIDYGWEKNAIPTKNVVETILQMSMDDSGELLWNTLSLKWLLRKYQISNLEITSVNMPLGEFKFMSNDERLLHQLDSVFSLLSSSNELTPLQNKWFYPERYEKKLPTWVKAIIGSVLFLLAILLFYFVSYQQQVRRISTTNNKLNRRLSLILQTSGLRVWIYDTEEKMFTWYNDLGKPTYFYTPEEFSRRYHESDFKKLMAAINKLSESREANDEGKIILELKAVDIEDGDAEEHDFKVALSVLRRDTNGQPVTILGIKRDVTEVNRQHRLEMERNLRYWAVFNTPMAGVFFFDENGQLRDINQKACDIYQCSREAILAEQLTIRDLFAIDSATGIADLDGFYVTNITDFGKTAATAGIGQIAKRTGQLYQDIKFTAVYDKAHTLLGLYGVTRDITERFNSIRQQRQAVERMKQMNAELSDYVNNINYTLSAGNVRMVRYLPATHALTIYSGINIVRHTLMQARCMTLIDDSSKKRAMRQFGLMDNYTTQEIDTYIRTSIHNHNHDLISLQFHLVPTYDKQGNITEYFGICRDVTEQKAAEEKMRILTAKTQEVENAKNSFLKNVSYEIRTPLNAVVGFASLFEVDHSSEDEQIFVSEILANSDKLLNLISNILFLSRIDAGMVEIDKQPTDFSTQFEYDCETGWEKIKKPSVKYVVENPYEKLMLDIDSTNLGHIIRRVADNAARYTSEGTVRARYDYIGRTLRIVIDDTGEGIPQSQLTNIFERFVTTSENSNTGLGLTICKSLTELMGGSFEISSEEGLGTTVWITIPCQASEIKRKKMISG